MRALCGDRYFGGEGEEMGFFSVNTGVFIFFFLTAGERINTDEPYLCVCVCLCKRRVRSGTLD